MDFINDVSGTSILWRYMDLSKFLDLLLHKHLIFPRYDKFEDTYEGYANNFAELARKSLCETNEFDANHIDYAIELLSDSVSIFNYYAYISCWHLNDFESAGMWKLYCTSDDSLVIKTRVDTLKKSIQMKGKQKIVSSKVTYDYKLNGYSLKDIHGVHPNSALLIKRESFEHEKEYRLILTDESLKSEREKSCEEILNFEFMSFDDWIKTNIKNGIDNKDQILTGYEYENNKYKKEFRENILKTLKVNRPVVEAVTIIPEMLIEEIIISPHAPKWFLTTVQKLVGELGYKFKVSQSNLYDLK
ncbi:hypothetical protein [Acinetobacter junii]|uniref:hypothetical protein n=1 Tax=Acinetobacter junii TaxID=40215 RepID=UPI000F682B0B|nr:hypothetical protein [Acinetobacter junii]MDH1004439.1 hypothetical protein [Acinetobacter junii]QXR28609.1 hypothetical protein EGT69_004665 [Acinetobacter junii]